MGAKYKVSLPDGSEYVVNDTATLQHLYRDGRITGDTIVAPLNSANWQSLRELFDLTGWQAAPTWEDGDAASYSVSANNNGSTYYGFNASATGLEKPSSRGARTAGILLLINAALSFLSLIAIVAFGFQPGQAVLPCAILTLDILIGINLCRGEWAKFAMWRLTIGAVLVSAFYPIFLPGPMDYFVIASQIIFLGGFVILLYGEYITIPRTIIGAGVVTFAWLSIIAGGVLITKVPVLKRANEAAALRVAIKRNALPDRRFDDPQIRNVNVDLPSGWVLLKPNNPVVPVPQARMVAAHADSGCNVSLLLEYMSPSTKVTSIDEYFTAQAKTMSKAVQGYTEVKREATHFGDDQSQRLEATWERGNKKYHSWYSVHKVGNYFFLLSGWCLEGDQNQAFPKFEEFEKRFTLPPSDLLSY